MWQFLVSWVFWPRPDAQKDQNTIPKMGAPPVTARALRRRAERRAAEAAEVAGNWGRFPMGESTVRLTTPEGGVAGGSWTAPARAAPWEGVVEAPA